MISFNCEWRMKYSIWNVIITILFLLMNNLIFSDDCWITQRSTFSFVEDFWKCRSWRHIWEALWWGFFQKGLAATVIWALPLQQCHPWKKEVWNAGMEHSIWIQWFRPWGLSGKKLLKLLFIHIKTIMQFIQETSDIQIPCLKRNLSKTKFFYLSFSNTWSIVWNLLSSTMSSSINFHSFRSKLKMQLFRLIIS